MTKIQLTINGIAVETTEGTNVLQAALDAGIYIPHLCYHPDLRPAAGCKLCSVDIEGTGIVQGCDTMARDGMNVTTDNAEISRLRTVAMEFILASHPADCTSCAAYLNCELQALMQYLGVAHSRLRRIDKRNTRINTVNPLIKKEMERCIQCGRCVRACEDMRGVAALRINKRDGETYIGTDGDAPLAESVCRFCGACVEVCPTGAIQDADGVFAKDAPREKALVPCHNACPAGTDAAEYVRLAEQGRYSEATAVIREKLTFPRSLGYVCNHKCEASCKRGHLNEAIAIRDIKRFAVEHDEAMLWQRPSLAPTGRTVGVIGGGPAGLTAAYYLAKKGHSVTVYEKLPQAGGQMTYGIPKYRLAQDVVDGEVDIIKQAGVEIITDSGVTSAVELKQKHDAVLIAVGTHKGRKPPIDGSGLENIYAAVDFCRMINMGTPPQLGNRLVVAGGGNVAFDCARGAKRLGVPDVTVVCLESRDKMLADKEEIDSALEEGITIINDKSFVRVEGSDVVSGLQCINVIEFSFDSQGRIQLNAEEGSEHTLPADTLVFATGQGTELDESIGVGLAWNKCVSVSPGLESNVEGIFAAGDCVTGTKVVVEAIAQGRTAAESIDKYLGGDGDISETLWEREAQKPYLGVSEGFGTARRAECVCGDKDVRAEAGRCLKCRLRLDIRKVRFWGDAHYRRGKKVSQ